MSGTRDKPRRRPDRRRQILVAAAEQFRIAGEHNVGMAERAHASRGAIRSAVGKARPDLGPDDVDLLLWAVLGVSASVGYGTVEA